MERPRASESLARSVVKGLSYRFFSSAVSVVLVFFVTRSLETAFALAGADCVVKLGLYFVHERGWSLVPFGLTSS